MTQDEIRKLLGGYASNELTADERRILFEAALEDQELFNALEKEDALRELLEDPVSRDQVRRALESPVASNRRPSFWSRRWAFGVAIPAVIAVIVIVIMNRAGAPRLIAPPVEIASNPIAPSPKPGLPKIKPETKESLQAKRPQQVARALPALAPQIASPSLVAPRMASLRAFAPSIPDAVRQQFAAGLDRNVPRYQGPLVQYSVVRSGPAGKDVRLEVTPQIGGYLALYRVDASGNSQRVYPASDVATRVLPNLAIQIPNSPMKIADAGERLRLVFVPAPASAIGQSAGAIGGVVNGLVDQAASPLPAAPIPLVVDIPLAPN
jgi:hypothetical protein